MLFDAAQGQIEIKTIWTFYLFSFILSHILHFSPGRAEKWWCCQGNCHIWKNLSIALLNKFHLIKALLIPEDTVRLKDSARTTFNKTVICNVYFLSWVILIRPQRWLLALFGHQNLCSLIYNALHELHEHVMHCLCVVVQRWTLVSLTADSGSEVYMLCQHHHKSKRLWKHS